MQFSMLVPAAAKRTRSPWRNGFFFTQLFISAWTRDFLLFSTGSNLLLSLFNIRIVINLDSGALLQKSK